MNIRNFHINIMYKMTLYMEKMIFKYAYDIWCKIYDLVCIENFYNIQMIYLKYSYMYLRK